ncbi:MAG: alkaline phosphatase D family protein [Acidobacteriota bacterium]
MPANRSGQTQTLIGGPICGAVTESSAGIRASVRNSVKNARLLLSASSDLSRPRIFEQNGRWHDLEMEYEHDIVTFQLTGLAADTRYYYGVQLDDNIDGPARGSFLTFPEQGVRANFSFAFGACSDGDNPAALDAIGDDPRVLFFFHVGDLHYRNPKKASVAKRLNYYDAAVMRSGLSALMKRMPFAYTWDDHDFFLDDTGGDSNSDARQARAYAREAYDIFFPHYAFTNGPEQQGIYQSFQIGRILFVLTDLRFNQKWHQDTDNDTKAVLGDEQFAWLESHFQHAADYDLIVMTSSFPWIGDDPPSHHGNWIEYKTARRKLANLIKEMNVANLSMIGGDAHMLAIDDGSHSGYAEVAGQVGKGGFPVFIAGPLDNRGSQKGGPYSHGKESRTGGSLGDGVTRTGLFSSNRQFGLCEIAYPSTTDPPIVKWSGWRAESGVKERKIWYEFRGVETAPGHF